MSTYWWRVGSYIWTACAAGWFVIFCITELPETFVVSVALCIASLAWNLMIEPED